MRRDNWEKIVEETYEEIYRFSLRMLNSPEDARENTQDTFLRAFRSLKGDEPQTQVRQWLYTIARNSCIDRRRWWNRWRNFISQHAVEVKGHESRVDWEPIFNLPQRQREVFILRHWHGFSTEETAQILGISDGAVKSHLKRAIGKLKESYLREEK